MLKLSRTDRKDLREALTSGFRAYSSLKIVVSDHFDFRLDEIASSKATKIAADELIERCEEQKNELALIIALYQERPLPLGYIVPTNRSSDRHKFKPLQRLGLLVMGLAQ